MPMRHPLEPLDIVRDAVVREALAEAWKGSEPGLIGGHEEGGFIALTEDGNLSVKPWPIGEGNLIRVPRHAGCVMDGLPIVATYHTHPNTGPEYLQEPSETDKRGVKEDADLKGSLYVGEFVVASEMIYLITPGGTVRELGAHTELLG